MKPILLQLTAFGPFSGTQTVDFRKLEGHDLFLVQGQTGAGKTTLFDGVCYALFGVLPGTRASGQPEDLRCHLAPSGTLCTVSFTFQLGSRTFRVERSPAQARPKLRGTGTVTVQPEAHLYEVDGDKKERSVCAAKTTEVTRHVEELLGLDARRFKQVLMLPQGEFREFLLASSSDKEQLLERLFGTSLYKEVSEQLKAEAFALERNAREERSFAQQRLGSLGFETISELAERIETIGPELLQLEETETTSRREAAHAQDALTLGRRLELDFRRLEGAHQNLERIEASGTKVGRERQRLELAERAEPLRSFFAKLNLERERGSRCAERARERGEVQKVALERLRTAQTAEASLPAAREERDLLIGRLAQLDGLLPLEAEELEARAATKHCDALLESAKGEVHSKRQHLKSLLLQLEELDAGLKAAQEKSVHVETLAAEAPRVEAVVASRRLLVELDGRKCTEDENATAAAREAQKARAKAEAAASSLERLRRLRDGGMAGELATSLVSGQPCPVCGSADHPAPAALQDQQPSREQVSAAERALTVAEAAARKAEQEAQAALTRCEGTAQERERLSGRLGEAAEEPLQVLETLSLELQRQFGAAQAALRTARELTRKRPTVALAIKDAESDAHEAEASLATRASAAALAAERLKRIAADFRKHLSTGETLTGARGSADQKLLVARQKIEAVELEASRASADEVAARQARDEAQSELAAQNARIEAAHALLARESADRGFSGLDASRQAMLSPEDAAAIRTNTLRYDRALAEARTKVEEAASTVRDQQRPDVPALAATASDRAEAATRATQEVATLRERGIGLENARKELGRREEKERGIEERLAVLGKLAGIVAGENRMKLSLQRFMLASRMDEVAVSASHRLERMSRGRYALTRTNQILHGNRGAGLDLIIEDRQTGHSRAVTSLSGGEMFMASLSLALGLADVVTARSGGVRMDALFIDEGFGSLDDETLDLVMRTLEDLRAGGRLVGLISHVTELKERIPTTILVSKGPQGSTVEVRAA